MKAIVLDGNLTVLDSPEKLRKPLNLYGFVRKSEDLIYIFSVGNRTCFLPLIGQITQNGSLPENLNVVGMFQEGQLAFYYRRKDGWERVQHYLTNLDDAFARTPFPSTLTSKIKNACIVLFGLGSMGSRLADDLVRSGLGHLRLVDPDVVSIENLSRHLCDMYDLARFKARAVRERILRVNPFAKVDIFPYDVFQKDGFTLDKLFQNVDLVIATTDRNAIQLRVNYECCARKIPALFAGCYEEARGGEVLFILPGETGVCLECLRGGVEQPKRIGKVDYSSAQGPEDYKGEPGLNAAINFVTDVAQQYAIALLLRKEKCEMAKLIDPERNYLLIGGALGEGYYFFKRPFHFINPILKGPWKDCGTCQNERKGKKVDKDQQKIIS